MDNQQGQAADWVQALVRDYQDKLTCGLYEAIYSLDEASLKTVMHGQAQACVAAFLDLTGLHTPMDLDSFLSSIRTAGPSQVDIQRQGDVIHWTELHRGECVCPFVRRGVIRLDPKLCTCGAHWVKYLFRTVANIRIDVEIVETVATGGQNCRYRVTPK